MLRKNLWIQFATFILTVNVYGASLQSADLPNLISVLNSFGSLSLCNEKVPLDIQEIRERLEKEFLLTVWDRPQVVLWLKRSRRFLPIIEGMLKEQNIPDDLKYLAIAESALRPHAGSKKGAVGFWQFMAATGRKYGLIINERIDERRNVFFSTQAAIRYFQDLYKLFGSWTLAFAAFNMGEEGLKAEILAQGTDDYYRLYLPLETQRFIFRILAVKLIFLNPTQYGFVLSDTDYYPPLEFDSIEIACPQEIPIYITAQAAGTYFKVIKDLNPHIRGHYLSRGSHHIFIPKGSSASFDKRYQHFVNQYIAMSQERIYIIQQGDNLSTIAKKFNIPLAALIIWNRIDLKRPIHPGQHLVIYPEGLRLNGISVSNDSEIEKEDSLESW